MEQVNNRLRSFIASLTLTVYSTNRRSGRNSAAEPQSMFPKGYCLAFPFGQNKRTRSLIHPSPPNRQFSF